MVSLIAAGPVSNQHKGAWPGSRTTVAWTDAREMTMNENKVADASDRGDESLKDAGETHERRVYVAPVIESSEGPLQAMLGSAPPEPEGVCF